MPRPRRAAAMKPKGHYADTANPTSRKRSASQAIAGRSKRRTKKSSDTEMKDADVETEDPNLPLGLSTRSFTPDELKKDLNISYKDLIKPAKSLPQRQKRWTQPETKAPIVHIEDTPKGWNMDEPDLDPNDLDAQIQRCLERIVDRIMSDHFEFRLEDLLKKKKKRDAIMALEPGLSWPVVQRLNSLGGILKSFKEDDGCIPTVKSIMAEYRSGALDWTPTLVTYWSQGKQISQPRPFRFDEFDHLVSQYGQDGFWVEGLFEQNPPQAASIMEFGPNPARPNQRYIVSFHVWMRAPGTRFPLEFQMMDDTGASFMQIDEVDFDRMARLNGTLDQRPPRVCVQGLELADGTVVYHPIYFLEVNLFFFGPNGRAMILPEYEKIPVVVSPVGPDGGGGGLRCGGPWLRHRFYTSSVPNGTVQLLHASDDPVYYQYLPTKFNPGVQISLLAENHNCISSSSFDPNLSDT